MSVRKMRALCARDLTVIGITVRLEITFTDGLPEHWQARVRRSWFWWVAEGWYSGPEVAEPKFVVHGWTFRQHNAITQVRRWIKETAEMDKTVWLEGELL